LIRKLKDPRREHWKYRRATTLRKLLALVRHSRKTERSRTKTQRRKDLPERRIRNQINPQYSPQARKLYKMFPRAKSISIRRIKLTVGDVIPHL
jgi:hypothetical protein